MPDVKTYKITNVNRLDEWDSRFGKMQDYSVALEGEEGWIKLTQKTDTKPPVTGEELQGYVEDKTNSNGTSYRKFKKENPEYAGHTGSHSGSSQEGYIVQMLEELTGRREVLTADTTDHPLNPFSDLGI